MTVHLIHPTLALIIAVAICVLVGILLVQWYLSVPAHGDAVASEQESGNLQTRRRMAARVGRGNQPAELATVKRAEHARGWSWIVVSCKPGEGPREQVGVARTRRGAKRALARVVAGQARGRSERGAAGLLGSAVILVCLAAVVALVAPQVLSGVLTASSIDWLQSVGGHLQDFGSWLLSLVGITSADFK